MRCPLCNNPNRAPERRKGVQDLTPELDSQVMKLEMRQCQHCSREFALVFEHTRTIELIGD